MWHRDDRDAEGDQAPLVGRPRGPLWRTLQADGVLWESQVLLVGAEVDLAARVVVTEHRIAFARGGSLVLDLPRAWLRPAPVVRPDGTLLLSIQADEDDDETGAAESERVLLRMRDGHPATFHLLHLLGGGADGGFAAPAILPTGAPNRPSVLPPLPEPVRVAPQPAQRAPTSPASTAPLPVSPLDPFGALGSEAAPSATPPAAVLEPVVRPAPPPAAIGRDRDWNLQPIREMLPHARRRRRGWGFRVGGLLLLLAVAYVGISRVPSRPDDRAAVDLPAATGAADETTVAGLLPRTPAGPAAGPLSGAEQTAIAVGVGVGVQETAPPTAASTETVDPTAAATATAAPTSTPGAATRAPTATSEPPPVPTTAATGTAAPEPTSAPAPQPAVPPAPTSAPPAVVPPAAPTAAPSATEPPPTATPPSPASTAAVTAPASATETASSSIPSSGSRTPEPATPPVLPTQPPSVGPNEVPDQAMAVGPLRFTVEVAQRGAPLPDFRLPPMPDEEWVALILHVRNTGDEAAELAMSDVALRVDPVGNVIELDGGTGVVAGLLGIDPAIGDDATVLLDPGQERRLTPVFAIPAGIEDATLVIGDAVLDLAPALTAARAVGEVDLAAELPPPALVEATVTGVVDGERIEVELGGAPAEVRYLGIDAPSGSACYAEEGADANAALVEGQRVWLERERTDADILGSLLRDVWIDDGAGGRVLVAARLAADGAAVPDADEPNVRYAGVIAAAAATAESAGEGLWGGCPAAVLDDAEASLTAIRAFARELWWRNDR